MTASPIDHPRSIGFLRLLPRPMRTNMTSRRPIATKAVYRAIDGMKRSSSEEEAGAAARSVIREHLRAREVELPPSPYDTAWVAMVPLLHGGGAGSPPSSSPHFPQCVAWIMRSQLDDGSWRLASAGHPLIGSPAVTKRVLSSTLACVLALARWDTGRDHVRRGLQFIGRNISVAMDEQTAAPAGFIVSFPAMIRMAIDMGLDVPLSQADVHAILRLQG